MRLNRQRSTTKTDLLPAVDHPNPTYAKLEQALGRDRLFILSAGWGLIPAVLTPAYDITFSNAAEPFKKRRRGDLYLDLRMIADQADGPILFLQEGEKTTRRSLLH